MKQNQKRFLLLLAAVVLLAAGIYFLCRPQGNAPDQGNLLQNSDFSVLDDKGMPESWYTDAYFNTSITSYEVTEDGAHIVNQLPNDARFAQNVSVAPNTLYCFSGQIKADTEGGWGGNLSIDGVYLTPEKVYKTNGEWQDVALYGYTGEDQKTVTVFARLGGYSGESTGEAWFRNLSFRAVEEVPEGFLIQDFYLPENNYPENLSPSAAKAKTGAWLIVLCSAVYLLAFLLARKHLFAPSPLVQNTSRMQLLSVLAVALGAVALRMAAALLVPGYDVDIGCFTAWSMHMAQVGPVNFYNTISFCDYPPGYLNVLWIIGLLGNLVGTVTELMVKMPAILSDAAICILLYTEGKKRLGHRAGLITALLWALNPVSLVTGACWGQTDSLMTLLLLLSVLSLSCGRWKFALPLYVAAVLVKPQALMFGPMGVAALVLHLKNTKCNKKEWADILIGLSLSLVVFAVLALPFLVKIEGEIKGLSFLLNLYGSTMNSYGYVTINACNPYFILGLNWLPSDYSATLPALLTVLFIAVAPALVTCILHRKNSLKKDLPFLITAILGLVFLAVLMVLYFTGNLTYATLSTCMIVCVVTLFCVHFLLRDSMAHLPQYAAGMLMLLFVCAGMMHERYLFPVVVLLFLGYLTTKDKRLVFLMAAVSVASFLNIACVLERNIRIGGVEAHLNAPMCGIESDLSVLEYVSAVLTTLFATITVYVCLSPEKAVSETEETLSANKVNGYPLPDVRVSPSAPLSKRDWIIMLVCTLLYACLAFTNLGSTKAPQTAWVSKPAGSQETIVLDLGEEKEFSVLYFPGILYYDSTLMVESGNEISYRDMRSANINYGNCFSWHYVTGTNYSPLTGRYVRLSTTAYDMPIYEVIIRDAKTGETLPYSIVGAYENETVAFINDEQNTLEGEPGYYNSTYFDEIYHARTGFEHLHGLPTYETSHPPLGKVLISWCIGLFGMTPFGWRFAGTMAGVLMLPAMYLLGKLLSRNKWGGLFAMLFITFDLMHFTQTRIATIDSFVVLFILWSVYCMLYWFKLDYFHTPFLKTLIPLGLSGLFMGLSIASKWTGCYNGVGLALIFFWGLFRRYRIWKAAKEKADAAPSDADAVSIAAQGNTLIYTVLSCFVFFVAIPLVIYYLSYIPYFAYSGGVSLQEVIRAAIGMFDYHSKPGLGMDHPYYSPWYEWPFIGKPMWYYNSAFNTPESTSTILAMGNPAVWWVGLIGLAGVLCLFIRQHIAASSPVTQDRRLNRTFTLSFFPRSDEPRYALLIILFLVQYLPWVLVPRGTYIYHYFPSVPFIILCTGLCLDKLHDKLPKAALILGGILLLLALVLFIGFFPYASGWSVPQAWLNMMRWFPGWLYY